MADKAVLFGVNEYKRVSSLRGCVNDVEAMKALLTEVLGFSPRNVRAYTDAKVTKAEVLRQMNWLFRDATGGDRLVFHLSAHGSNIADEDGDEPDGRDEIFCMHDMDFDDPESYLLDDELRAWTETLPAGAQLLVVLDTCHSGTGTRLLLSRGLDAGPPMLVDDATTLRRARGRVARDRRSGGGPGARSSRRRPRPIRRAPPGGEGGDRRGAGPRGQVADAGDR